MRSVRTGRTSGLSPNTTQVSRSGWAVGRRRESGLSIWNGARAGDGTANAVTFGADGQSILFVGDTGRRNSSFRLRLDTNELIQLTGAPFYDYSLKEWARRLSVAPKQEMFPQTWGRIKAKPLAQ